MTEEILAQIEEMNRNGMNDRIIAEKIFCSTTTVARGRRLLGLSAAGINRTKKRYVLYDGKTTQYIMEGTARECADYMGMTLRSFYQNKSRFRRGTYKKYEIYEVEK